LNGFAPLAPHPAGQETALLGHWAVLSGNQFGQTEIGIIPAHQVASIGDADRGMVVISSHLLLAEHPEEFRMQRARIEQEQQIG
jgi:hypothetical protein